MDLTERGGRALQVTGESWGEIKPLSLGAVERWGRGAGEGGVNNHSAGYTNLRSLSSSSQQGSGQRVLSPKGAHLVSSRALSTAARATAP